MNVGDRVVIIDDVGKANSELIGKEGTIIDFKWNKFREEKNLPVVKLDNSQVVSGWSLWYSPVPNKVTEHE